MAENKGKILVMDSSTLISLSSVCLLWILKNMKRKKGVRFLISPTVKKEVVDDALAGNRFKFSGLRMIRLLKEGTLEVMGDVRIDREAQRLTDMANRVFSTRKSNLRIIHKGEMESMAIAKEFGTNFFATDEKVARLLLENPVDLKNILSQRLKTEVMLDEDMYKKFTEGKRMDVIRSAELAAVGYEMGLFRSYTELIERGGSELLKGLLWALKSSGCGISYENMDAYVKELVGR